MREFRYIDDIEDWLRPMDYQGFWAAIAPLDFVPQPKEHCDEQIASGVVTEECVLDVIKDITRRELQEQLGLDWRPVTPWLQLVE